MFGLAVFGLAGLYCNSGSLEKMEYRLSEYSPTERKVDDREGQCNVWYNGNCKGGFYTSLQLAFRARR
ncbi:hypothetical protein TNCV_2514481 [Trichonephila clavipes]|nr:hypothetical protein TNCV_2514481 [Trichonephila clavipes]